MLLLISLILVLIFFAKMKINNEYFINEKQNYDVFVINLDRSKERMLNVKKQLNNENIDFYRFPAVDGAKLNKKKIIRTGTLKNHKMDIGALGCSLSHIGIWKNIIKTPNMYNDLILVLKMMLLLIKILKTN